jgi:group I intron endonuclease
MGIIYKVTSIDTGKSYIGQTEKSIDERITTHIYTADSGSKYHFHRAIRKYGIECFDIDIIEDDIELSNINDREIY